MLAHVRCFFMSACVHAKVLMRTFPQSQFTLICISIHFNFNFLLLDKRQLQNVFFSCLRKCFAMFLHIFSLLLFYKYAPLNSSVLNNPLIWRLHLFCVAIYFESEKSSTSNKVTPPFENTLQITIHSKKKSNVSKLNLFF